MASLDRLIHHSKAIRRHRRIRVVARFATLIIIGSVLLLATILFTRWIRSVANPRNPETMWIPFLATYILTGVVIITCTSAKREMRKLGDGVTRPSNAFTPAPNYPLWKVLAFFSLVYAGIILAWPLFLRSWFPRREKFIEPKADIPKAWLTRGLSEEESDDWWWEFQERMQEGDELWEFESPKHFWDHLAGRAGIALVRNGEVVASRVTKLN